MGIFFTPFFWGLLLIVWGVTVVISVLFRIDIPVGRIVVAFILIYLGIRMLTGWGGFEKSNNTSFFRNETVKINPSAQEYNVIFGRREFDLTETAPSKEFLPIKIQTIFGSGVVKLNPTQPVKVHVNSCFADALTPEGNHINFGNYTYVSSNFKEGQPYLAVEATVAFGSLAILSQKDVK